MSDFCRVSDCGCVLDKVYQIDDTPEPIQDKKYLQAFLGRGDCVWNVWRYLFQREFLMRGGLCFVEGADCAEDLEFVVRALTKWKTDILPQSILFLPGELWGDAD